MSGKSTLLRAVGLNAVMAQMGSVVCAEHLRMPPLRVETSMRVHDSLEDGVSFFMAELKRLKQIVDRSEAFADRADRHLLVLLDEVLQGTNSRERHVAVTRVLARLVRCRAVAAVSTHDLDLATAAELADACRPFHFRETFVTDGSGRRRMTFDYHLHDGLATTTNALELLRLVGLDPGPEQR
jgi:DNA mismatch repair ATPase MutS